MSFYISPWSGYAIVEYYGNMYELVADGRDGISASPLSDEQIKESAENMIEMEGEEENGTWTSKVYCLDFKISEVKDAICRV